MIATLLLQLLLAAGEPTVTLSKDGGTIASVIAADEKAEAGRWKRVNEAQHLATTGHAAEALPLVDALLAEYAALYPEGKTRWFVAREMPEALVYTMLATTEAGGDGPVQDAQVLTGVAWADTYFIKGFALVELQRTDEARAALDRAVALSPYSAAYLIERAEVSKLERKWDEAMGDFEEAEAASEFSPEDEKRRDKGQAMRGQAFVHIEQGNLDAAEKVLKACLKLDRNDARAKEELQYIEQLRAAAKP